MTGLEIDVADEDSVSDAVNVAVKQFGRLDILVNNAGIAVRNQPQEYSADDWDQVLDINLKGTSCVPGRPIPTWSRPAAAA